MFNWVDAVVIIILVYNLIRGWSLGLFMSVVGIAGYILAFVISKIYYEAVAQYLVVNFSFFSDMKHSIINNIEASFKMDSVSGQTNFDTGMLESLNLPTSMMNNVVEFINGGVVDTTNGHIGDFATAIAEIVINGISIVLIFLGVLLAVKILSVIINSVTALPVIKQANKVGGLLLGTLKGALFVFVLMTLVVFITPFDGTANIVQAINQSKVAVYFYNYNIIIELMNVFLF